jgi:excinuclease ABC subunit C
MKASIIKKIKSSPKTPGVYIFYKNKEVLYIGKAVNLCNRLKNYLRITDLKTKLLHQETTNIKWLELSSPIEALIKESSLIKTLKPKLNVYWQDDKNHFFVSFTKDDFPKVKITHQPKDQRALGPFTDGKALRLVLKIIRRHFPYCTCRENHLRICLNSQIDNCFGFCCQKKNIITVEQKKIYNQSLKTIKDILNGKKKNLLKRITRDSDLWAIDNILSHSEFLNDSKWQRIECYDISNLSGKEAVGAMTVLKNDAGHWQSEIREFRKFKIKNSPTQDDPRMIAEILTRRLNHPEWSYPDLIVIDGGITQYNAAQKALDKTKTAIKLISFAKPQKKILGLSKLTTADKKIIKELKEERIIERIIKQTHNYAINYHRQLRDKIRA